MESLGLFKHLNTFWLLIIYNWRYNKYIIYMPYSQLLTCHVYLYLQGSMYHYLNILLQIFCSFTGVFLMYLFVCLPFQSLQKYFCIYSVIVIYLHFTKWNSQKSVLLNMLVIWWLIMMRGTTHYIFMGVFAGAGIES